MPTTVFEFGSRPSNNVLKFHPSGFEGRPLLFLQTVHFESSTLTVHFSNPNKFCHNWTKLIDSLSALSENVNQVIFRQNGQFCSYLEILICLSRKPRDKSKVLNLIHLFINYQFIIWSKNFENFENPFVQINIHRAQLIVQHIV